MLGPSDNRIGTLINPAFELILLIYLTDVSLDEIIETEIEPDPRILVWFLLEDGFILSIELVIFVFEEG